MKTKTEIIMLLCDRIDHITNLVDLEWNGLITRDELARRVIQLTDKWRKEDNE